MPYSTEALIAEIRKRPKLYDVELKVERAEKLDLWKEVGAAIYDNWQSLNKATIYDKVLQLQKKWRSLKDAYRRELRARRTGVRVNRRVYMYFNSMSFLGGFEGLPDPEFGFDDPSDYVSQEPHDAKTEEAEDTDEVQNHEEEIFEHYDPLTTVKPKKRKAKLSARRAKRKIRKDSDEDDDEVARQQVVDDSDRLFLLSFAPEMSKLPGDIKMWVRAKIARVMQEAVTYRCNNTRPSDFAVVKGRASSEE